MKQVLVLLSIMLALIPEVFAEDDKWIDGIRFRFVTSSPDDCQFKNPVEFKSPVSCGKNPIGIYMPWKIERRNSHFFDMPFHAPDRITSTYEGEEGTDEGDKDLFPLALELPETLMTSWSFRGGLFEFEFPTELKDLQPSGWHSRDDSHRTSLYNDFFNASDKSFADANSNWEMSADVKSSRIFLGYTLGFFIPIGENNRFFKVGAGLGIYYLDISLKMNLCSAFKRTSTDRWTIGDFNKGALLSGECFGKTEIDSYSVSKLGISTAVQMTF